VVTCRSYNGTQARYRRDWLLGLNMSSGLYDTSRHAGWSRLTVRSVSGDTVNPLSIQRTSKGRREISSRIRRFAPDRSIAWPRRNRMRTGHVRSCFLDGDCVSTAMTRLPSDERAVIRCKHVLPGCSDPTYRMSITLSATPPMPRTLSCKRRSPAHRFPRCSTRRGRGESASTATSGDHS
jgi:hypothetical protein